MDAVETFSRVHAAEAKHSSAIDDESYFCEPSVPPALLSSDHFLETGVKEDIGIEEDEAVEAGVGIEEDRAVEAGVGIEEDRAVEAGVGIEEGRAVEAGVGIEEDVGEDECDMFGVDVGVVLEGGPCQGNKNTTVGEAETAGVALLSAGLAVTRDTTVAKPKITIMMIVTAITP